MEIRAARLPAPNRAAKAIPATKTSTSAGEIKNVETGMKMNCVGESAKIAYKTSRGLLTAIANSQVTSAASSTTSVNRSADIGRAARNEGGRIQETETGLSRANRRHGFVI